VTRIYSYLFILLILCCGNLSAQEDTAVKPTVIDTIQPGDTISRAIPVPVVRDTLSRMPEIKDTGWRYDLSLPLQYQVMKGHPYYGFGATPEMPVNSDLKIFKGKETLFYVLLALLLLFAFLRQAFPKYFNDLFRLFFRTTLKQRQIREQLMQTPLPSLLLNGFYFICAGLYVGFLLEHFEFISENQFWLYSLYSCIGLSIIYLVKFVGLKVTGWVFGIPDAANSYIFIVFIINKVIGVFLLPFLVLIAFLDGQGYEIALVLSWLGVGGLYLYRFILTYSAVHNQVRFNLFHFFLYLCAFEIAPLLLIYKLLLIIFQ
jgi:hypothetical protein